MRKALAIAAVFLAACAPAEPYFAGGSKPFPADQKAVLDQYSDMLSLGINHDWLEQSEIDSGLYIQAIGAVAAAAREGRIPGAVIYADRINDHTMPVAIGWLMTDPQKHRAVFDSSYYVHDLTGALVTAPLVHIARFENVLKLEQAVGELLPELAASDKAPITVEMLLRHASALPAEVPEDVTVSSRDELYRAIAALPLTGKPGDAVVKSPLNFMMLGLVLERVRGEKLSALFSEQARALFEMEMASMTPMPDRRQFVAPDFYSARLGHLAWMEPLDPFGAFLDPNAGHVGLALTLESAVGEAQALLALLAVENKLGAYAAMAPIHTIVRGDSRIEGGEAMGLGVELGRFGEGSFGWDSPMGSSFWILPAQDAYIIYLSNASHPAGIKPGWKDPRDEALPLLAKALEKKAPPATPAPKKP